MVTLYAYNFELILLSGPAKKFARICIGANDMSFIQNVTEAIYQQTQKEKFQKYFSVDKVEIGYRQPLQKPSYIWNAEFLLAEMQKEEGIILYLQKWQGTEWLKPETEQAQEKREINRQGLYSINYNLSYAR